MWVTHASETALHRGKCSVRVGKVDGNDSGRGHMTDMLDKPKPPKVQGKSVQEYIDELPQWPDGTALKSMPMTAMQFRIWAIVAESCSPNTVRGLSRHCGSCGRRLAPKG